MRSSIPDSLVARQGELLQRDSLFRATTRGTEVLLDAGHVTHGRKTGTPRGDAEYGDAVLLVGHGEAALRRVEHLLLGRRVWDCAADRLVEVLAG